MSQTHKNTLPEPEELYLVKHLEQSADPEIAELVELAKQGKPLPPEQQSRLQALLSFLIADPEDLYGKAIVTDALKNHAAVTANVNTVANWVDFVSNFPFYLYSFQFLGTPVAFTLGFLLDGCVLWISNLTATAAANETKKTHRWAKMGVLGMIALSVVKSIVSGVGVELLNNQSGLNAQIALKRIEQQQEKVEKLKEINSPQYINTKQRCESGRSELNKLPRNHPRWDSLYTELFGSYGERERDWSQVPTEKLPTCRQVNRLEKEAFQAYETAKAYLEAKLIKRSQMGNDVMFLKQEMPEVYTSTFTEKGEIASGVEAVQIATENFFGKLMQGDFASLGFSLFFFSLSVITSAVSVLLTIAYSQREDVQMSRDEEIEERRDLWLEEQWRNLVKRHESLLVSPRKDASLQDDNTFLN